VAVKAQKARVLSRKMLDIFTGISFSCSGVV
jgi:hypothetical protein